MENLKLVEFSNIHGISVSEAEKRKNQNLNTIFFLKLIKRNQSADRKSSRGRPGFRGTLWVASRVPSALSTSNS